MLKLNSVFCKTVILCLCQLFVALRAAKILAVFGIPNPAENVFATSLLNALNERGHDITVIIRFSHNMQLNSSIKKAVIDENADIYKEFVTVSAENFDKTLFANIQKFYGKSALLTLNAFKNPFVVEVLKEKHFDLIMLDTLMSEPFYGLGEYFGAPMIGVSNLFITDAIDSLTGNFSPLSTVPSILIQHMFDATFWQRFLNVALYAFDKMGYSLINLAHQRKVYEEIFPNSTISFDQANRNFSLVLLNQHFSLSFPRPYLPNMIEVAGLHIEENLAVLPSNVQQFLNESETAIIYVFMNDDEETLNTKLYTYLMLKLLNSLKDLPYKIVWHMDFMPLEARTYSNIFKVANISHFSLLAHPKVKLFVTNGEIESVIEAIHFATPVLGLPLFSHQHINMNLVTRAGYGLSIKLRSLCEDKLKNTVLELLNNPTYIEKIKNVSEIFRDQPMKAKDKAIYWVEYVLRHKGAVHLMSKGRFLNFWQLHNIDVFSAYLAIFILIIFLVLLAIKRICILINKSKNILKIKLE